MSARKMKPFIETFTGKTFQPLTPVWQDIDIVDVGHALSNQGRFTGHTRVFYSVAEHSVRIADYLASRNQTRGVCLWGLLHDASEAYLVDLPTPLKQDPALGRAYRRIERRLTRAVCRRFNLPPEEPEIVRWADARMLATEVRDLMHGDRDYWKKLEFIPIENVAILPWAPRQAEERFLRTFTALGGVR